MKKKKKYNRKEGLAACVFILPALIPLLLFWIGPVFYSAGLSFTDWDMISAQINFIGMDNYKSLLGDPEFYRTLKYIVFFHRKYYTYHFIWCTDCIGTLYSETGWLF